MLVFLLMSSVLVNGALGLERCGADYDLYLPESICLRVLPDAISYSERGTECSPGTPSYINTADKADFIANKVDSLTVTFPVWTGVLFTGADWKYGAIVELDSYAPWAGGAEPTNWDLTCVGLNVDREWTPISCAGGAAAVCLTDATPVKCEGAGFGLNPTEDACIKVVKNRKKTFQKAGDFCKKLSGHLATKMISRRDRRLVMGQLKFKTHLWIGVEDKLEDGNFVDINGIDMSEPPFKRPRSGKYPGRYCVTLKKGKWYPRDCNKRFYFVCQKDPVLDPPAP